MRRSTLSLAVWTLACSEPLPPALDVGALNINFAPTISLCSQELFATFERRVEGATGAIEIAEIYGAPNGGYELVPEVESPRRGQLQITIVAHDHGGVAIPVCHPYSLEVEGLPPGAYDLFLLHTRRPEGIDTVLVTRVEVT